MYAIAESFFSLLDHRATLLLHAYFFNYQFSEGNQIRIPFTFSSKNVCFSKRRTKILLAESSCSSSFFTKQNFKKSMTAR